MSRDQFSCVFTVKAVPEAESSVREHLRAWLDQVRWPGLEACDVVLAVHEAVSAAVSRAAVTRAGAPAARGDVDAQVGVSAMLGSAGRTRWLTVRVSGPGRQPAVAAPPGPAGTDPAPGLSRMLMQLLMARVETRTDPRGATEVTMLSHPVAAPAA